MGAISIPQKSLVVQMSHNNKKELLAFGNRRIGICK